LQLTHIDEAQPETASSIGSVLSLLKDKAILILFLGIFFVVGADVGMNTVAPKLLIERCGYEVQQAGYASSVYFVCRTAGAFVGTLLLARYSSVKYFRVNIFAALAAIIILLFMNSAVSIMATVGIIGFLCSSIFSVIYGEALRLSPKKENEVSGLMIMGVCGGAVIPPLMGLLADTIGNQCGSIIVIAICIVYLTYCSLRAKA
jgi:fucose permease